MRCRIRCFLEDWVMTRYLIDWRSLYRSTNQMSTVFFAKKTNVSAWLILLELGPDALSCSEGWEC